MANYLVEFCLNLYHSEVITADCESDARSRGEMLLEDDGFWEYLLECYDDPMQTDWLQENVEVSVYGRTSDSETVGEYLSVIG